jgi:hypothetical protein
MSGIKHDKIESQRVVQRLQEGTEHILGPMEGSFKVKTWLHGHGATMAGSPTVDAVETYWSYVTSNPTANGTLSATASTTLTGGTVTAPTTTASGTFSAGSLCRIGSKGDTKADGQMYPIATHVTTALTPLVALAAAPANGDVLYPCVNFFLPEDPGNASGATAVTGLRFRWRTSNLGIELHGCYPMAVTFGGMNPGEIPFMEVTWGISWWRYTATSGVSAVTQNQYNPAPTAAGSFNVAAVGTATRSTRTYRNLTLAITLGVVPLVGPGSASIYGKIVGAKRIPSTIKLTWMEDADAATATPVLDGFFTAGARKHIMFTGSCTNGSAFGWYMPNVCITGARPVQTANENINRLQIEATAYTGATTTSELTLSAFRWGSA